MPRSPAGATRSPDGASRAERQGSPLGYKRARRSRRAGKSEGLLHSPRDRAPFAAGVFMHPSRSTACSPRPAGSDQGSLTMVTSGRMRPLRRTRSEARLPVRWCDSEIQLSASSKTSSYIAGQGFEAGQNRAPTRFAEGGRFAEPICYGPRSDSQRRSMRRAPDSTTGPCGEGARCACERRHTSRK